LNKNGSSDNQSLKLMIPNINIKINWWFIKKMKLILNQSKKNSHQIWSLCLQQKKYWRAKRLGMYSQQKIVFFMNWQCISKC